MAKADGPGFVDKHIEKVALLTCLLVLIYALTQYGVSSKRSFEIAGQQDVAPKDIDSVLLDEARQLEKRVEAQEAPHVDAREDMPLLETMQNDPLPAPQPADKQAYGVQGVARLALLFGAPLQPTLTGVEADGTAQAPSLAKIEQAMPAPARPVCWAGTELMVREVPGLDDQPEVKIEEPATWRAVSWYPWQELDDAWQKLLRSTVIEPRLTALGYEVEIQVKQPDGTWKTSRDVKPVMLPIYDSRTGDAIQPDPVPEYTGENGDAVLAWLDLFGKEWTEYQLQPDYHEVWIRNDANPSWDVHFPADVLEIYPEEEQGAATRKTTTAKRTTRASRGSTLLNRLRTTAKRPTSTRSSRQSDPEFMPPEDMMMPPEGMPEGMYPPGIVPPGRTVTGRATRTTTTRRPLVQPKTAKKTTEKEEKEIPPVVHPDIPDFQTQLAMGKVLLWFHVNNIELGREYRCRFRMVFANPLLTYDKDVEEENRKDAYAPSVKSKWSEWSEPVSVKRDVEFFVTGAFPRGNSVTVSVFTRWMDQRLMYPISKVTAGGRIHGSRKVKVLNPVTGEAMKDENGQDPVVEFDTGAVAIQIDFNRRIQTSAGPRDDVEMIYLDPEGNLQSRSLYLDRNSQKYKDLEAEAREAASLFEPERPKKVEKKKGTQRQLQPMEFDPTAPPPGMAAPDAGGPFEVNTRTRSSSKSRNTGSSRSRSRSSDRD